MKVILILILLIVTGVLWIFTTSTTVNNDPGGVAFKVKSAFYWIAVILSFIIGIYINS